MNSKYYKLPFDLEAAMTEAGVVKSCSEAESIAQNLMMLITTRKGENRYNSEYGNAVWDLEFDNAVTTVEWETVFVDSLLQQIKEYEARIIFPRIDLHVEYVEHSYGTKGYSEIKKKAKIAINATLSESGERYSFSTQLFLSPISID